MNRSTLLAKTRLSKTSAFALLFAASGLVLLLATRAATPTASYEAESATLSGPASVSTDAEASDGQFVRFGGGGSAPNPEAGWEDAVASNDLETIKNWYNQRTGFESYYDPELGRYLTESDLEPIGNLEVYDDNVVIEKKDINGVIRIYGDNVTIRGSRVRVGGYTYGVQATGSEAGSNWKLEHMTIEYAGSPGTFGNRAIFVSTPGEVRYVKNLDGFGSGFRSENSSGQTWEYNYVGRIVVSEGSHNTAFTLRSNTGGPAVSDITLRRNLFLDGTSAALSFYSRSSEVHRNLLFEENIFDINYPDERSVNYCVNKSVGSYSFDNVLWRNNMYGQSQSAVCGTSGPWSGGSGNGSSGERYIDGTQIN